jgi:hypothetical protein
MCVSEDRSARRQSCVWPLLLLVILALALSAEVETTEYVPLALHEFVALSDVVALVTIEDPDVGRVRVERTVKGNVRGSLVLVDYVDRFAIPAQRRSLSAGTRELMFLKKVARGYAPVQDQLGRWAVGDGRVNVGSTGASVWALTVPERTRGLDALLACIGGLVDEQARIARSDPVGAQKIYVSALSGTDPDLQEWALTTVVQSVDAPSATLKNAVFAYWTRPTGKPLVANAVRKWRMADAAPRIANALKAADAEERAWGAVALGGSGNRAFWSELRQVARTDPSPLVRAWAVGAIPYMLGHEAVSELRVSARDESPMVRSSAVVAAYNMLAFGQPMPRWPKPPEPLIEEVRRFLTDMTTDPERGVADNARTMLTHVLQNGRPR